jgi:hypothetical protein
MITLSSQEDRTMRTPAVTATLSAIAIGAALAMAPPAKAHDVDPDHVVRVDGWRHGHWHHYGPPPRHWRRDYYPPPPRAYYVPPPGYYYYYAPPPRVYYPPPPPRYYAPPPGVGVYLRF